MSDQEYFVPRTRKIGIIGSGLIGRSWAMIYAAYGYDVYMYDVREELIDNAIKEIHNQIVDFSKKGILRGHYTVTMQQSKIFKANSLMDCVSNALHVQECVPEIIELKRKVFQELDEVIDDEVIVASSASNFLPSLFTENCKHRAQMLVAHPVNPPYVVPLVELVPSPWTSKEAIQHSHKLLTNVGQKPVTLKREVVGFIVNRIQNSILQECYRLVRDDIISVEDVEAVMSEGLGMRYAFIGPFETGHLNAPNGLPDYFERYAKGIHEVASDSGPPVLFGGETAAKISEALFKKVPADQLKARAKWRDEKLIALSKIKKN